MSAAIAVEKIPVDFDVAMEIAGHEAVIRKTYRDSKGVNTWSVGLTSATGHRVDRYIDNPQTMQHCMNIYVWALQNYADGVRQRFKGQKLTKEQFTAALSFHWNTGAIGRAGWVKLFLDGQIAKARASFLSWAKPPEIEERRGEEAALFFDGKWSNDGTMTEYTRLTKSRTPVWGSAVKVDVSKELREAFRLNAQPVMDQAPQPNKKPLAPTLSPVKDPPLITDAPATVAEAVARDEPQATYDPGPATVATIPAKTGIGGFLSNLGTQTTLQYVGVIGGTALAMLGLPAEWIDVGKEAIGAGIRGYNYIVGGGSVAGLLLLAFRGINESMKDKAQVGGTRVLLDKMDPAHRAAVKQAVTVNAPVPKSLIED